MVASFFDAQEATAVNTSCDTATPLNQDLRSTIRVRAGISDYLRGIENEEFHGLFESER